MHQIGGPALTWPGAIPSFPNVETVFLPAPLVRAKRVAADWPAMFESLSGRLNDVFDRLKRRGAARGGRRGGAARHPRCLARGGRRAARGQGLHRRDPRSRGRARGAAERHARPDGGQDRSRPSGRSVGRETSELNLSGPPPRVFLMVGLQGSGKTTTSAKFAYRLRTKERRRALLASLDVQRPAAQEQLAVLADQAGVASLPIMPGQTRWRSPRAPSRRRRVQATTSSSWIPPAGCTSTRP